MKINNIKKFGIIAGSFIILTACSENSWNDTYLDGFSGDLSYEQKEEVSMTLEGNDYYYTSRALNSVASTKEEKDAASAISTNNYFNANSPYPAEVAIPYYLASSYSPYFTLGEGSVVNVTFMQASAVPEIISEVSSASNYILTASDYESVWGSSTDYVQSFSPSHPADRYIPNILKAQYPDAQEGTYAIITYNEASENPVFGDSGEVEITDNIKNLSVGDYLSAVAVVTGQCVRGLILTDNAGSILYYNTTVDLSAYPIGSIVKVSGPISSYGRAFQLTDAASIDVVGNEEYTYPDPINYTPAMIDEAVAGQGDFLAQYVTIQGQMSISGSYYNVIVDGATSQGSLYYATDEVKAMVENGKSYTLYGYYVSVSSGKYFNMIVTDAKPVVKVELTDTIKNLAVGGTLNATAIVTGQCTRGLILTDNAGSILYYNTSVNLSDYPIGTAVKVSGPISSYGRAFQLTDAASVEVLGLSSYNYPSPTAYSASMIEEAVAGEGDFQAQYVSLEGTITISGNYYNILIDGSSAAQGSLYYATDEIKNALIDGNKYTFYGYYVSVSSGKYFNMVVTSVVPSVATSNYSYQSLNTRATLMTPTSVIKNEAYYFNGTSWEVAEGVAVLNPSDYLAMNEDINDLTDVEGLIPIYLKLNYPYAQLGDEIAVAYNINSNGASCDVFQYDGNVWELNNIGLEQLTGRFVKTNGSWKFTKYIGKTIFSRYEDDEITLDRGYMIASGAVCAIPVNSSNSYGYLYTASIKINNGQVVTENANYAFYFDTTYTINGEVHSVPEGKFLIRDSNDRYLYLQGAYSSFNLRSEAPYIEDDGSVGAGYLFTATKVNGNWAIVNDRGESGVRTLYFASNYNNFAMYTSQSDNDSLPELYILEE